MLKRERLNRKFWSGVGDRMQDLATRGTYGYQILVIWV